MNRLTAVIVVVLIIGAPLAQGGGPRDETRLTLRHDILRMINRDRAAHGLSPVQLDAGISVLGDAYCERQIREGTTGHFATDGQPPYMRFSFAGVQDGISENAAAWSANYTFSARALHEMARRSQAAMMAERPPHDGHRRTILDPHATHVGIGVAWERGEFRLVQEFVRRYVTWTRPLPRAAAAGDSIVASGAPIPGYRVEAISVHHEPVPQTMPAHVANALDTYRLPKNRRDYLPRLRSFLRHRSDGTFAYVREEYTDGRRGDFNLRDDGSFHFNVPLHDGHGVYTVVVWVTKDGQKTPIAASNVSIRVSHSERSEESGRLAAR
ncbi:MAG TPA: CAP domain-containing protein [Thermoanaerobaculia bacterium]|nr:CAP domain-containing protein [Thermoanaerobaculia bacterium]